MSRNARQVDGHPVSPAADPRPDIAAYLLARRAATLRLSLAIMLPLAAAAIVVSLVMPTVPPGASALLDVIAFGSGGIGTYLARRAGRGLPADALFPDGEDSERS